MALDFIVYHCHLLWEEPGKLAVGSCINKKNPKWPDKQKELENYFDTEVLKTSKCCLKNKSAAIFHLCFNKDKVVWEIIAYLSLLSIMLIIYLLI